MQAHPQSVIGLAAGLLLGLTIARPSGEPTAPSTAPIVKERLINFQGDAHGRRNHPVGIYKVPAGQRLVITDVALAQRYVRIIERHGGRDYGKLEYWWNEGNERAPINSLRSGLVFRPGAELMLAMPKSWGPDHNVRSSYFLSGYLTRD